MPLHDHVIIDRIPTEALSNSYYKKSPYKTFALHVLFNAIKPAKPPRHVYTSALQHQYPHKSQIEKFKRLITLVALSKKLNSYKSNTFSTPKIHMIPKFLQNFYQNFLNREYEAPRAKDQVDDFLNEVDTYNLIITKDGKIGQSTPTIQYLPESTVSIHIYYSNIAFIIISTLTLEESSFVTKL